MIEVSPNLWVGDDRDYNVTAQINQPNWFILSCAKEPYHREALGYVSHGAPKDHPEYLFARRGNRLILNMVDADDPRYFPDPMIDAGLAFISEALQSGGKILVHCNQGQSRGPGMALMWILMNAEIPPDPKLRGRDVMQFFLQIYPSFQPKDGILGVISKRIFGVQDWAMSPAAVKAGHVKRPPKESGEDWFLKIP